MWAEPARAAGCRQAAAGRTVKPSPIPAPVSHSRPSGRAGAGEPLRAAAGEWNGAASMDAKTTELKRITPRSPRSALEPEMVDAPLRRSRSARHPLVVIGNAVFSLFVLLAVVGIAALFLGKQRFEMPGPLAADKIVNIPHGSGIRDIADVLQREGVIDQPWCSSAACWCSKRART